MDDRDRNPAMLMDDLRRVLVRLERAEEGMATATAMIDDANRMLDDAGVPDMRPDGHDAYTLIERVRFFGQMVNQRHGEKMKHDDVTDAWMAYMEHAGDLGTWPDTLAQAVQRLSVQRDAAMNRSAAAIQIARAMLAEASDYADALERAREMPDALESTVERRGDTFRARLGMWRDRLSMPLHPQAGKIGTDG